LPLAIGVPDIVHVLPRNEPATPGGRPATVVPVVPGSTVYVMLAIGLLLQTVWALVPPPEVKPIAGVLITTVTVLLAVKPFPSVTVTLYEPGVAMVIELVVAVVLHEYLNVGSPTAFAVIIGELEQTVVGVIETVGLAEVIPVISPNEVIVPLT